MHGDQSIQILINTEINTFTKQHVTPAQLLLPLFAPVY